jgi:hypothetical protein
MNSMRARSAAVTEAWESLRGDPMPWLLDEDRPSLHWRVLVELLRRPLTSPAVSRARGGADAAEPIASLLAELNPDGTWATDVGYWKPCSGPGWRFVAAVQWGADPTDPRLQVAAERFLETAAGEGGFARGEGGDPVPWLTARMLHALAELGWCRHPRFQEGLAWLDEEAEFDTGVAGGVTAVALLGALTACPDQRRPALRSRTVGSILRALAEGARSASHLGHPNFGRTDLAEMLWALARAEVGFAPEMGPALRKIQRKQMPGGIWRREEGPPVTLPIGTTRLMGRPSQWVTLKCVTALMRYAVDAKLPRMYPEKPS